jgi:hypothetical protein
MDLTEIKKGIRPNNNRIVIKSLTIRQRELLKKGGLISSGIGLGTGLFTLYSLNSAEFIPGEGEDVEGSVFVEGFIEEGSPSDYSGETILDIAKPVLTIDQNDISFGEAFQVARDQVGAGGWFVWNKKVYNTYYKEEWENLSFDARNEYAESLKIENYDQIENAKETDFIASVEIVQDENSEQKADLIIQAEVQPTDESIETDEISIDINVNNPEVIVETDQMDKNSESITFELPEDAVIFEIPESNLEDINAMVFDATENTLFMVNPEEPMNPIDPIKITQLSSNNSSNDLGLTQELKDIVEYSWDKQSILVNQQDADHEIVVTPVTTDLNETVPVNEKNTEETTEYIWGETTGEEANVSFAHDIQVVDDYDSNSINLVELEEPGILINDLPINEELDNINEPKVAINNEADNSLETSIQDDLTFDNMDDFSFDQEK